MVFPLFILALFLAGMGVVARYGDLLWFLSYVLVAPQVAALLIDLAQGRIALHDTPFLYTRNLWRVIGILLILLLFLPMLIFLGPVGLFSVVVMVGDVIARFVPPAGGAPDLPVLCGIVGIGAPYCAPGLTSYFALYFGSVFIAVRYGNRIFNAIVDFVFQPLIRG